MPFSPRRIDECRRRGSLSRAGASAVFLCAAACVLPDRISAQETGSANERMLPFLLQMVQDDPSRSDSWRLIGRIYHRQFRYEDAARAYEASLRSQPDNIAAHADYGRMLWDAGDRRAAREHFANAVRLGPGSSYAADLIREGYVDPPDTPSPTATPLTDATTLSSLDAAAGVVPVDYEITTFDGADDLDERLRELESLPLDSPKRFNLFFEAGALYNTNLGLTPISRQPPDTDAAGTQLFAAPSLDWIALRGDAWRAGPTARGFFTLNEEPFSNLNLTSFQPGVFMERDFDWFDSAVIGRLEYGYAIDLLGGDRFGDRHSATASLTTILSSGDVLYAYLTGSVSDFADDGLRPERDSLDGPAVTAGVSRLFQTDLTWLPTWSLGGDLEHAQTDGDDGRYSSARLFGDATFRLTETVSFVPQAAIGYRHYPDFTGVDGRDELTGRLAARLRWQLHEHVAVSAVVNHDRFFSDNDLYDVGRTEVGLVLTFSY